MTQKGADPKPLSARGSSAPTALRHAYHHHGAEGTPGKPRGGPRGPGFQTLMEPPQVPRKWLIPGSRNAAPFCMSPSSPVTAECGEHVGLRWPCPQVHAGWAKGKVLRLLGQGGRESPAPRAISGDPFALTAGDQLFSQKMPKPQASCFVGRPWDLARPWQKPTDGHAALILGPRYPGFPHDQFIYYSWLPCYFYVKRMDSSRTRRGLLRPEPEQTDPQLGRRPQASCGWPRWEHPRTLCQGPCLVMGQSPAWHEHGARVTLSGQQCWGLCPESPEHQMFASTQNPAVSALQLLLPEPPAPRTFSKVP